MPNTKKKLGIIDYRDEGERASLLISKECAGMLLRELSLKQDRKRELSQIQRKSVVNALTIRRYIPKGQVKSPIELVELEDAYELQYLFEKRAIDEKTLF